jgi:Pyruvate/2-oxoacid:ferredoxin oxidoreductase delta subunit/DNA-binding Lrp family transcriptional regulator
VLGPVNAPKHEKVFDLLKTFWDEETIKVLAHFPMAGEAISVQEVAEKSGIPKEDVKRILKKANQRRTIAKIGIKYALMPILPGVFEAYYISRQDTPENLKKAAKSYRFLIENPMPRTKAEPEFSLFRPVLPIDSTEKLIKIDENVDTKSKVLSFELIEDMINRNKVFCVIPCQCRLIAELDGTPCKVAPSEMGCFVAGPSAQALINMGFGKQLSKEEAIEYIKKTEKAGLVHNASNDSSDHNFVCNCCACHCGALFPMKKFHLPHVQRSNFAPTYNSKLCIKCETCVKKCPMEAISHPTKESDIVINYDLCIGCGVCAANCKKNAILMEKVREIVPAKANKMGNKSFDEVLQSLLL